MKTMLHKSLNSNTPKINKQLTFNPKFYKTMCIVLNLTINILFFGIVLKQALQNLSSTFNIKPLYDHYIIHYALTQNAFL